MKKEIEQKMAQVTYDALRVSEGQEHDAHILLSLVKTLESKKMLNRSDSILYALKDLFDKERGVVKAHVTTQERLSPEKKKELELILKEKYKASDVRIIEKVDERLLGGIKIKIGDKVFDTSIKNKLVQLAHTLQK